MDDPEQTSSLLGPIDAVVREEADELMVEAGVWGDPDAMEALALDLLDGVGDYDQGAEFGLLLIDELRRRAEELRERPQ